jgi:DTW domain-containing protein YfiP
MCALVKPLVLATHVVVLVHRREVQKTTNTARLVPLALRHAELRTVGLASDRSRFDDLVQEQRETWLLFPREGSRTLSHELAGGRPVTLVVPDGNWPQARRMARNEPQLARLPAVHLPESAPRRFELRRHPLAHRLSTFEALARALGILEGEAVQRELEQALALKVERTLATRRRP